MAHISATPYTYKYKSFFQETIESVPPAMSEVLESYSGIAKDAQIEHILKCRDAAYKKCPYPCIGSLRFLNFDLSLHPLYQEHILRTLKQSNVNQEPEPLFLDLGTAFGQDVRKLIYDGAPAERVWASDIEQHLIDIGFKFFNDEDKLPRNHFLCPGDLLSRSPEDRLNVLNDKVTILHITAVFHLFPLEDQKTVVERCLHLLSKEPGRPALLLGMQVGSVVAGPFVRENGADFSHRYRHNRESWEDLWNQVTAKDQWRDRIAKLEIKSELVGGNSMPGSTENLAHHDSQVRRHVFEVWVTFKH